MYLLTVQQYFESTISDWIEFGKSSSAIHAWNLECVVSRIQGNYLLENVIYG